MHKLTRRNVIVTLSSSTLLLCPAILNAQDIDTDWADIPTDTPIGESQLINVDAGVTRIEISALQPGDVAVIARPSEDEAFSSTGMTQYIAVQRRTDEQIAFGQSNDRDGTVQDSGYFVTNLVCSHRGKAVGLTGDPSAPFACTDRGDRHSSVYDASGFGVSGASEGEYLSIPDHTLTADGENVILELTA